MIPMPNSKRKHLFIINPISFARPGSMDRMIQNIEDHLRLANIRDWTIYVSKYPRNAISVIRKFMADIDSNDIVRVYAIGGDGILFDCLNGIVGIPNTELAIIPHGVGSDFARSFGNENYELFKDIGLQIQSPAVPTDIINCGSNYALSFCLIGFESAINKNVILADPRIQKIKRLFPFVTPFYYSISAVLSLLGENMINQRYQIIADGENLSGVYMTINVSNCPHYAHGRLPNGAALPDDGFLDLMLVNKVNPLKAPFLFSPYLKGNLKKVAHYLSYRRIKKISIRSDYPLLVCLDAETFFDTGIDMEIMEKAINFVAVNNLPYKAPLSDIPALLKNESRAMRAALKNNRDKDKSEGAKNA
jgi:diacylglycerol kinase family enzyme